IPAAPTVAPGQLTINSTPEGATIRIDGRTDPSWVTPFNLPGLAPGQHTVNIAKGGYSPEIRTIEIASNSKSFLVVQLALAAGMGAVNVKTQPKGAQVAVNNRILDKSSPLQFYLNPGNYVVDITMSGYKDIHRVITVEKSGKLTLDETMERQ